VDPPVQNGHGGFARAVREAAPRSVTLGDMGSGSGKQPTGHHAVTDFAAGQEGELLPGGRGSRRRHRPAPVWSRWCRQARASTGFRRRR
jgi:hypothetical protein